MVSTSFASCWKMRSAMTSVRAGAGAGVSGESFIAHAATLMLISRIEITKRERILPPNFFQAPALKRWVDQISFPRTKVRGFHLFSQFEDDVDQRNGFIGSAVALSRTKANLPGSTKSGFVETVPEAAHYFANVKIAGSAECYAHQDYTLQVQRTSFLCVSRSGLVKNFYRSDCGLIFRTCFRHRSGRGNLGESCLGHRSRTLMIALAISSYTVAKAGAGDCAARAASSTGAIALSLAGGQIEGADAGHGQYSFLF